MSLYPLQEHWIVNSVFEDSAKEGRICASSGREEHAKVDWAGCEEPGARCGCWDLGGGRGDMALPDFVKAIDANEGGRTFVEGSAVADGTFEDRRGGCSSTRRRNWWRGKYRWWRMDRRKSERTT